MKSRLPLPDVSRLDAAQQAVYESIVATRGNISGPFLAWMHSPVLASHAEKLGAFCRYHTQLPLVESELLILCVAAQFECVGEQQIHEPIAQSAGLGAQVIEDLRAHRPPVLVDARQDLVYRLARALLGGHRIAEPLYREGLACFGEQGMVELVGIMGYYTLVAMTLNAFDMRMP